MRYACRRAGRRAIAPRSGAFTCERSRWFLRARDDGLHAVAAVAEFRSDRDDAEALGTQRKDDRFLGGRGVALLADAPACGAGLAGQSLAPWAVTGRPLTRGNSAQQLAHSVMIASFLPAR